MNRLNYICLWTFDTYTLLKKKKKIEDGNQTYISKFIIRVLFKNFPNILMSISTESLQWLNLKKKFGFSLIFFFFFVILNQQIHYTVSNLYNLWIEQTCSSKESFLHVQQSSNISKIFNFNTFHYFCVFSFSYCKNLNFV